MVEITPDGPVVQKTYTSLLQALFFVAGFAFFPIGLDWFEYPKLVGLLVIGTCLALLVVFWSLDYCRAYLPQSIKAFLVLYFIGHLTAFIFSSSHYVSFLGSAYRYQGLTSNLLYDFILLAAAHLFSVLSKEKIESFFKIIALGTMLLALMGIVSMTGFIFDPARQENRIYATLGNPNYLASFLITTIAFVASGFRKPFSFLALGIVILALLLTGSRSAWIAGAIALLVIAFFVKKELPWLRYKALAATLLLATLFVAGTLWQTSLLPLSRFAFHGQQGQSLQTRAVLWQAGWRLYLARPLLGYGHDTLPQHIYTFLPKNFQSSPTYVDRAHSEPLDQLLASGPLTLLAYLGLFGTTVFLFIKKGFLNSTDRAALYSLVALFLYHLVNFSTISSNILWYLLLGYMLGSVITGRKATQQLSKLDD